jgi:hypothetical protein
MARIRTNDDDNHGVSASGAVSVVVETSLSGDESRQAWVDAGDLTPGTRLRGGSWLAHGGVGLETP